MECTSMSEDEIIELTPYPFQVGGHTCVLVYDDKTICKPLARQEQIVYELFPKELKPFIPRFRGIVQVLFEKDGDEVLAFAVPSDYAKDYNHVKSLHKTCSNQTKRNVDLELEEGNALPPAPIMTFLILNTKSKQWLEGKKLQKILKQDICFSPNSAELGFVSQSCIVRRFESSQFKNLEKFLLLENLSHSMERPCVLDLKMGTRCYGDGCSQAKSERKRLRALNSTSASLGVRLCGMMTYNASDDLYTFTDKYKGRVFNDRQFYEHLRKFLYDGVRYRNELLPTLKRKLQLLLQVVEKIENCRFYCSSLLLIYNGHQSQAGLRHDDIIVKMVDFAQTRVKEEPTNHHVGPDKGYIIGLKTLINFTTSLEEELC